METLKIIVIFLILYDALLSTLIIDSIFWAVFINRPIIDAICFIVNGSFQLVFQSAFFHFSMVLHFIKIY